MTRLSEASFDRSSTKTKIPNPQPSKSYSTLEGDLLQLLSDLEHDRSKLEPLAEQKDFPSMLPFVFGLIRKLVAFDQDHHLTVLENEEILRLRAKIQTFFAGAEQLNNRFPKKSIFSIFAKKSNLGEEDRLQFVRLMTEMHEIMQTYFSLFTTHIRAGGNSRAWVETAAVFLVEIQRLNPS